MRSVISIAGMIAAVVGLSCLTACPRYAELPENPDLLLEDFGMGLSLGLTEAEAEKRAENLRDQCEIEVVSRDDLNSRAPYDTTNNPKDRVLLIFQLYGQDESGGEVDRVNEIRCYLADPANSVVTLAGHDAAKLTEQATTQVFGEPVQRTATGDDEVHYTYYFALDEQPHHMLELVVSFHTDGYCFALSLAEKARVK